MTKNSKIMHILLCYFIFWNKSNTSHKLAEISQSSYMMNNYSPDVPAI